MADTPVLDIHTVAQGSPVRIDGRTYTLRNALALTLQQSLALEQMTPRISQLMKRADRLKKPEFQELAQGLDTICRIVLDAPDGVHARLTDPNRVAILRAFIQLRPVTRPRSGAPRATRSTGARSFRDSRGSTVPTPTRGSHASRSASSKRT